jgi:hypothetical protein
MEMSFEQCAEQERRNHGTTWTRNESFDKNGYFVVKDLCADADLYVPVPYQRGRLTYWGKKPDQFTYCMDEQQVPNSLAVYNRPQYRQLHSIVRLRLEEIIGRKLYNTYFYDRFYWAGQQLTRHVDRDACEISVTIHVGSSLTDSWPIWIKTPDTYVDSTKTEILKAGKEVSVALKPGDGMIYKGCERPHWRDPMPGEQKPGMEDWHHQIFMHYVLQDGVRAHCAWDSK